MKKVACTILILTMAIFLISPLSSEARGGHGGGHVGWWVPWAVIGGAAVLAAPYYYAPYYAPPTVIIREQPPVYFQPAQSVTPPSTESERIFVYPRQSQSEELQAKDRYECHNWAVSQIWREPRKVSIEEWTLIIKSMPEAQRADYLRAQSACLDGRGYTVK
jgi:hypothetical protein